MNERVKRLSEEIRKLSPEEQADLLDDMVLNLDQVAVPEIDTSLLDEIRRRVAAYDAGEVATRDARQALDKYKDQ